MTNWEIALVVGLLAAIASVLVTISKQIERLIRVQIQQREQIERALSHPEDDTIRSQLADFLLSANRGRIASLRRDDFVMRRKHQDELIKANKRQLDEDRLG